MSDLIVRSYGTGEFTASVFNAVAATVNSPEFNVVLSGAYLISLVIATYQFIKVKDISVIAKNIFIYIGVVTLLLVPKYNLTIKDDIIGNHYPAGNVPVGLAAPAYLLTNTFYGLTRLVEITFNWTDSPNYSKTGFLFASHIVKDASKVKITNPEFNKSLQSFFSQCVLYDLYLGFYTLESLLKSDDIWSIITTNASKNRAFMLDGEVTICSDGIQKLNKSFQNEFDSSVGKYASVILPGFTGTADKNNTKAIKEKLLTSVGSSYGYLTGVSKTGSNILQQNILINAMQDAALNNPELGMYSYAVTRANAQKLVANVGTGLMMARWLPIMAGTMECMIYALFILICIYSLFTQAEKMFMNYIKTMAWIASWPVVFAILNFGFTWAIKLKSSGAGISFQDSGYLTQTQYDMSSMFGGFLIFVPYLSWGIMNLASQGLGAVFTQMSQLIGSSSQSLAMAASSDAVTGNMQMANTSFDNHSMFNNNSFKHNTNMDYHAGSMSAQTPDGTIITQTLSDGTVLNQDPGISRLMTSLNLSGRTSASISQQSDKATSAIHNEGKTFSESEQSASRSLYEIGNNINKHTSLGDSFSKTESGGYAEAASDYAVAVNKFAHDNNLSVQDASRFLRGAYGNASLHASVDTNRQIFGKAVSWASGLSGGGKISGGVKAESDRVFTDQDAENFSKAQEFLTNNNLTKTFDKAFKGVEEHRFSSSSSEGKSLIDNMNSSYDTAKQAAYSISSNMQKLESLRELSSYVNENSASFNVNESQEFIKFVANQPVKGGDSPMGYHQADVLLRNDVRSREMYAEQFVTERIESKISDWKASNINEQNVAKSYNEFNSDLVNKNSQVKNNFEYNNSILNNSNNAEELNSLKIDKNLKSEVGSLLSSADNAIKLTKEQVDIKGAETKNQANSKLKEAAVENE